MLVDPSGASSPVQWNVSQNLDVRVRRNLEGEIVALTEIIRMRRRIWLDFVQQMHQRSVSDQLGLEIHTLPKNGVMSSFHRPETRRWSSIPSRCFVLCAIFLSSHETMFPLWME